MRLIWGTPSLSPQGLLELELALPTDSADASGLSVLRRLWVARFDVEEEARALAQKYVAPGVCARSVCSRCLCAWCLRLCARFLCAWGLCVCEPFVFLVCLCVCCVSVLGKTEGNQTSSDKLCISPSFSFAPNPVWPVSSPSHHCNILHCFRSAQAPG